MATAVLAGASVLEIACGNCYRTQFLAPAAQRSVAIDAVPETLRIARHRTSAPNASFATGDAFALAFAETSAAKPEVPFARWARAT